MKIHHITLLSAALAITTACQNKPSVPKEFQYAKDSLAIFPDYKDIIIPSNIAPLNFQVKNDAKRILVEICADNKTKVVEANNNQELILSEQDWKELVKEEHGKGISFHIFVETENGWMRYPDFNMHVAQEPIDRYVSYRLIEPGYELYRQMGLYQRDMQSFEVKTIYENNRVHDLDDNHCVNCHNYQNYSAENMLFHVRSAHGGTIIGNKKLTKYDMKVDSVLSGAVYPSWHPKMNRIAFSSNLTGQSFHLNYEEKVEVMDSGSDLVYYDVDKNVIRNILKTDSAMETFPCWNPEGNKLYYCCAPAPKPDATDLNNMQYLTLKYYNQLRYDILSLDFDPVKETFGEPQMVVACSTEGKSAAVPRISPDGKYLLYTKGDYGQFHIWHKSADLWVKNLKDGTEYPLSAANSKDVDSYHSWSSNGRWIVFSSRRDDKNYTRLYLAYFDKHGQAHKAFMLPQEKPTDNILLLKSYNVPELTKDAVKWNADDFKNAIYHQNAQKADYSPKK